MIDTTRPDAATWATVVDTLVAVEPGIGMALAHARVELRTYPAGVVLVVGVRGPVLEMLLDGADDARALILGACRAGGIVAEDCAFVDRDMVR